jgi:hypothetical protein
VNAETRTHPTQRRARGLRWHLGQKWLDRFMKLSRTIGVPHRLHGSPASP